MRMIGVCAAALILAACGDKAARTETKAAEGAPAAAVGAPAGPAVASESREFRDWRATCDNGNACIAFSGGNNGWIRVALDAGPDAIATVTVGMWADGGDALTQPPALVLDGRRHATTAGTPDTSSFVIAPADVPAVLRELARAKALSLVAAGQNGELSASGVSASLLWIDERQGRLDTPTALIRRGDKPASTVPAAPALPVVTAAPAVSQAGFLASPDPGNAASTPIAVPAALEAVPDVKQCREQTSFNEYLGKAVTASRLDATTELWGIPCDSGAYNVTYVYFLTAANGADARLVEFPDATGKVDRASEYGPGLVNPAYDPDTRTLTAFSKARGIGDCGALQTWTWTGRGFVMSREQVMGECWSMVTDLWPTTWRTR